MMYVICYHYPTPYFKYPFKFMNANLEFGSMLSDAMTFPSREATEAFVSEKFPSYGEFECQILSFDEVVVYDIMQS